jgi:hypothetical protein
MSCEVNPSGGNSKLKTYYCRSQGRQPNCTCPSAILKIAGDSAAKAKPSYLGRKTERSTKAKRKQNL